VPPVVKKKRPERDFAEEKADLGKLKDAARKGQIHLWFADQSGMSAIPNVPRSWSPRGQPHEADASVTRKRVNILGALDYAANTLSYTLHEESIKRPDVVAFLDRLAHQHRDGKPTFVVLDNAPIHRHIDEEKIRTWLCDHQLILFPLPPYSPELNTIEILWKHAKYHWRKFASWAKPDLLREVNQIFQGYGEKFKIRYA
jgi:transposase